MFSKTKIKVYVKRTVIFLKMADIDHNKLIGLLIIAREGSLLSQEHIKERRKRRQLMRPWIRKKEKMFIMNYNHFSEKHW